MSACIIVECGGAFGRWLGSIRWADETGGDGRIDSFEGGSHQCCCSRECMI